MVVIRIVMSNTNNDVAKINYVKVKSQKNNFF